MSFSTLGRAAKATRLSFDLLSLRTRPSGRHSVPVRTVTLATLKDTCPIADCGAAGLDVWRVDVHERR